MRRRPLDLRLASVAVMAVAVLGTGCSLLVNAVTPAKRSAPADTAAARDAIERFWHAFRDARYDEIPAVHEALTAAYLANPRDARLALLLGHTHFWKVAERARAGGGPAAITDHLVLAERYLEEAYRLDPADARIPGWLGGLRLTLGHLHGDLRLMRIAYFDLRRAMEDYVEFNGFSFAFPLTSQPPSSPRLAEAVDAMWRTVEQCSQERYDRRRPRFDYARFAPLRTEVGRTRVCWNTPLVPHNMEGFFLAFGDLLLKAGHDEAARAAYEAILQVPESATWRFRGALRERLDHLDDWGRRLRDADQGNDPPYMLRSGFACTGCHAT